VSLAHLTISFALAAGLGIQPMDDAPSASADAPSETDEGQATAGDVCTVACLPEAPPAGTSSSCGDGTPDLDEECDDGNTASDDGCSATCEIEDGYDPYGTAPALSTTR
jgi:cysteine-rich repeat protein